MSDVTNIILITSLDEKVFVGAVNGWLTQHGARGQLMPLDREKAGGTKNLEVEVFATAINHLPFLITTLFDALDNFLPVLEESGGDASCIVVNQNGEHYHWSANIW